MSREKTLKIGAVELGQGLILAPMAGITDSSFRIIARRFGADLVTSEMVSAEGIVRKNPSTRFLMESHQEEKPLAIQLFGADPQSMGEAARMVVDAGADIIDLNMGCPVSKVLRQGAGVALMRDIERVKRVIQAVRRAVKIPVTVKIRSGWNHSQINAEEVACAAEAAGADAITLHPRTARQGLSGAADWHLIARVKRSLTIPVIGNGDVSRPEMVAEMRRLTGCDGVMIGRGVVGNPWIFKQAKELAAGKKLCYPTVQERLRVAQRHVFLYDESLQRRPSLSGFRSRLMWYSKGLPGSARLRASLGKCRQTEAMVKICEDFFLALETKQKANSQPS